ncbi:hypothetical protein [Streptomyces rhizosphaerihabitans]|uniref:hypothetical protein n=1 Tax=Streptomyces rhizosphaerihabitans TaxID=1266770 RepID=UPI0021C20E4E|nr:hypothetical protein [Streptomyces rhizosphaerihabitans]MCT9010318.1 hypothetical protein [Streptomyces rhizosphaerihabitans]
MRLRPPRRRGGVPGGPASLGVGPAAFTARPDIAVPYGNPDLATFLASQMVRRLSSFRVLDLGELLEELRTAS